MCIKNKKYGKKMKKKRLIFCFFLCVSPFFLEVDLNDLYNKIFWKKYNI